MKTYLTRLLYAIIGKDYLPPRAYWGFDDYLRDILLKVLRYHIENKNGYPIKYKSLEEYHARLQELYDMICDYYLGCVSGKDYIATQIKKEKEYHELLVELLPTLWD